MRRLLRGLSYAFLEVLLHIWAALTFLNFVGWMVRNRKYNGWTITETVWYDTVIGVFVTIGPMVASVLFMYNLLT